MFRPGIYLVADYGLVPDEDRLLRIVRQAIKGGVVAVQIRHKQADYAAMLNLCKKVLAITRPSGIPLIVNDWVDVAAAIGAEGVHIGQSDLSVTEARRIIGPQALLGLSIEDLDQTDQSRQPGLDYVAASPVFATPTKTDTAPQLGLEGLQTLVEHSLLPVVAIGGINLTNVGRITGSGAFAAAVVSAICLADNPEQATRALVAAFEAGRH